MNFFESISTCYKNFFKIEGRAIRSEYWWFHLFFVIIISLPSWDVDIDSKILRNLLGIALLSAIIPGITVAIRRLHDVNKSGGYLFLSLIPILGSIILLFMLIPEGDKGKNRFGINPLNKKNIHKKIRKVKK